MYDSSNVYFNPPETKVQKYFSFRKKLSQAPNE